MAVGRPAGAARRREFGATSGLHSRGLFAGFIAQFAILFTLGIILFMPFWDRRNQNLWDKLSSTLVVNDPAEAWGAGLRS